MDARLKERHPSTRNLIDAQRQSKTTKTTKTLIAEEKPTNIKNVATTDSHPD
jgi:hypothetical protein